MLRYSVPDALRRLRTVYGTVEYGAEQQAARACVLGSGACKVTRADELAHRVNFRKFSPIFAPRSFERKNG